MKNLRKYGLAATRKPKQHALVSGVAHVGTPEDGKGFAYFTFTEAFVDAVGSRLQQGVSPFAPAYLKVLYIKGKGTWRVFAMYLNTEQGVFLWEEDTYPAWLGHVRFAD